MVVILETLPLSGSKARGDQSSIMQRRSSAWFWLSTEEPVSLRKRGRWGVRTGVWTSMGLPLWGTEKGQTRRGVTYLMVPPLVLLGSSVSIRSTSWVVDTLIWESTMSTTGHASPTSARRSSGGTVQWSSRGV